MSLRDGTRLRPGDRIIELHMWSEQFPPMSANGPSLGWARLVNRCLDLSLGELARHLARRPELHDIRMIRAVTNPSSPRQEKQFARILGRYGFETTASSDPRSVAERVHRFGQNILISLMVLARNPAAFRSDSLRRGRAAAYLSRRRLEQRYATYAESGSGSNGAPASRNEFTSSNEWTGGAMALDSDGLLD
jgi:hypothetical protein